MKTENRNRRVAGSGRWGPVGLVLMGLLMALAFVVPAQAATPANLLLTGTDPAYPDITINIPGGGGVVTSPGVFNLQVTPAGGATTAYKGYCVNTSAPIGAGQNYAVDLQTAADAPVLATPGANSAAWLIQQTDALLAAAANKPLEAGALQTAVWVVMGEAVAGNPTQRRRDQHARRRARGPGDRQGPGGPGGHLGRHRLHLRRRSRHHAQPDRHPGRHREPRGHRRHGHAQREPGHLQRRRHGERHADLGHRGLRHRHRHVGGSRAHAGRPHRRRTSRSRPPS